jgi:hypothetical protein
MVHFDLGDCPDGILWITPGMKMNILQEYGKILFLDAQKFHFNKSNWPYLGPVVKDCEMKCVCQSNVCVLKSALICIFGFF